MTSWSHHVMETKHENKQTMETKDRCFCEESFIDRSFLILEIFFGGEGPGRGVRVTLCSTPSPYGYIASLYTTKYISKRKENLMQEKSFQVFIKCQKKVLIVFLYQCF